ncbi:MAG: DUF3801 domain-containing protein [Candidatus Fimivivens sp.]|nr:DUF3801 domain-containing protein [Candidatus Fimivivens sp.]
MDTQEELARSGVRVGVRVAELTTRALAAGVAKLLKKLIVKEPTGERTMRQMINNGGKLLAEELKGAEVAELSRIAKRYAVSFSAIKNEGTQDYTIFFKAANEHQIHAALTAYNARAVIRAQEQSKLKQQGDDLPVRTASTEEKSPQQDTPTPEPTRDKTTNREERSPFESERQVKKSKHPPRRSIPRELEIAKEESRAIQEAKATEKELTPKKRGRQQELLR